LLLVCGGAPHSGCAVAACGTGCDTPQYGHTGTKSARFAWQFVHCFKNVSPGAPWCGSSTRPAPKMYMEIGRFVYHPIQPASGAPRNTLPQNKSSENIRVALSKPQGRERMAALCPTKTWSSSFWLLAKARG
jgi:hypothetical protein